MSDSDSDLSTPATFPTDADIESGIREVVRAGVNDEGQITIKIARSRTEKALDLPTDFFKNDAKWKARSAELTRAAVDEFANADTSEEKIEEVEVKAKAKPKGNAGTKRKSDGAPKAKPKRRKKSPSVEPEKSEAEISAEESKNTKSKTAKPMPKPKPKSKPKPKPKPKTQPKSGETSALSSPPSDEPEVVAAEQNGKHTLPVEDDESDLSSVIDDLPPKKKRSSKPKSSSPSASSKSKPKAQKSNKTASKPDLSPDEEEIKRVQSWLLKCGIRKLWHRELAPYATPKEKIKHLKSMLEEVGMTGRFSAEKARQIKESRELAAELEEARKFNEQWGQAGSDEEEDGAPAGKPKRKEVKAEVEEPVKRRPMGLVDFGDSGEDSD
jgi:hypothetical protein